jgi:hypothetical protein
LGFQQQNGDEIDDISENHGDKINAFHISALVWLGFWPASRFFPSLFCFGLAFFVSLVDQLGLFFSPWPCHFFHQMTLTISLFFHAGDVIDV